MTTATKNSAVETISPAQAAGLTGRALWVDVRSPGEYGEVHIEGSVLHPLPDLDCAAVARAAEGRDGVVVVCRSGMRASQAAQRLAAAGLDQVRVLDGGVMGWAKAGHPVHRGRGVISVERQTRIATGGIVALSVLAGFLTGQPAWFALGGLMGAGICFSGVADWCGMGLLIAKLPWNRGGAGGTACGC